MCCPVDDANYNTDRNSLATIAEKIIVHRGETGSGESLCKELVMALEGLGVLIRRGELELDEVFGGKPSVILRSMNSPGAEVKAYSLRMMANALSDPANNMLSRTLEPACRDARKELIDSLRRLYVILLKPGMLEEARRWEQQWARAEGGSDEQPADPRSRLLQSVLSMSAVERLYRDDRAAFDALFEPIWEQIQEGELSESAAPGKLLDRVRTRELEARASEAELAPGADVSVPDHPRISSELTPGGDEVEPKAAVHPAVSSPPLEAEGGAEKPLGPGEIPLVPAEDGTPASPGSPVGDLESLAPRAGKAVYHRIMTDRKRKGGMTEREAAAMVLRLVASAKLPRECTASEAGPRGFQVEALSQELREASGPRSRLSPLAALDQMLAARLDGEDPDACTDFLLQVARQSAQMLRSHPWVPEGVVERYLRRGEAASVLFLELAPDLSGKSEAQILDLVLDRLGGREIDGVVWDVPWTDTPASLQDLESRLHAGGDGPDREAREVLSILTVLLANALPEKGPAEQARTRLDDWVVRGRAGNRLYKTLRRDPEVAACAAAWERVGGKADAALQRRFARAFFAPIKTIVVNGRELEVHIPRFEEIELADVEPLLGRLESEGGFGIGAQVWKVIAVAFEFLSKECGLPRPS